MIEIGAQAPDFTLKDQNNEEVTLSSFRGKQAVLIVFYPLAFTGICTGELCVVRDDMPSFSNEDVQVLTISVDSPYSHKIFAEREGYEFPLLSDFWPHGAVAQAYGVFNDATGFANRGHLPRRQGRHRAIRRDERSRRGTRRRTTGARRSSRFDGRWRRAAGEAYARGSLASSLTRLSPSDTG